MTVLSREGEYKVQTCTYSLVLLGLLKVKPSRLDDKYRGKFHNNFHFPFQSAVNGRETKMKTHKMAQLQTHIVTYTDTGLPSV